MINRDDIEAGDKVYTRDGGCLVARKDDDGYLVLTATFVSDWEENGQWYSNKTHPLDIIRIEKAPKPVVVEVWLGLDANNNYDTYSKMPHEALEYTSVIKLTIINGKLEKSEQVK